MLLDLHADFSGERSGGLVFPSLEEFSTVCCDLHKDFGCTDHNKVWKILNEMGIPDHLTCLLRNLYAGQEATVKTEHGITNWFQIGGLVLEPSLLVKI